jgi:molecular chaperone GrpE
MANRRSETDENTEDRRSSGEPEAADDSIEIVEVVGLDPEDAAPDEGMADPPAAAETPEPPVPYSRHELYDMLLRKQAEFENARKRMERETQESRLRISRELLHRLLPILDNFDRALGEAAGASEAGFREGVSLTVQQMKDLLRREGLDEIAAVGERFDPTLHEAVETRVVEGLEEGIVLEDLRKGYRFQGQLLRPSLVRVSAKGGKAGEPGT